MWYKSDPLIVILLGLHRTLNLLKEPHYVKWGIRSQTVELKLELSLACVFSLLLVSSGFPVLIAVLCFKSDFKKILYYTLGIATG